MNFDTESKSKNFIFFKRGGGGGGGVRGGYKHKRPHILYTRHIVMTSTTEPYTIPNGIQNRGYCSFNRQGKITQTESIKMRDVILVCDTSS